MGEEGGGGGGLRADVRRTWVLGPIDGPGPDAEDSDGGPADGLPQGKEEAGHLYRGGAVPLAAPFPLRRRQGNLSERRDREDLRKVRPVRGRLEQVRRFPRPARQRQSPSGREGQQLQAMRGSS